MDLPDNDAGDDDDNFIFYINSVYYQSFNYSAYPLIINTLLCKPFITTALRPQPARGITPTNTTINKSNRRGFKINFTDRYSDR